ncbi:MAG: dihydroxyacetone kinase subunit DhaK [Eubacteriales bacterium]|nr:dihydroxyacetone kinase subunit DhaK [Eubacteriales bacterium]
MQKILNNPRRVVEEMLQGYLKCHPDLVTRTDNPKVFVRKTERTETGKVGIVSGGGMGHFPAFIGYVKPAMLDAVALGEIFKAPPAEIFLDAFREADKGRGVVCVHGNYELDNASVTEAMCMARQEGLLVRHVVANDDIASFQGKCRSKARGLAGEVLLWKIAGAAAELRMDADTIVEVCERAMARTRSIGVGLSACIIPEVGEPNFNVIEGTMEFGIGHHGDPGLQTYKIRKANEIADLMMEALLKDFDMCGGREVVVMVSGLGGSTQMELYILFNRISDILRNKNIRVFRSYVGNYFTSLDMNGATVTLLQPDEEIKKLLMYKEAFCL